MGDSQGDVVSAVARSRNVFGFFGFALALCGLVFFWIPLIGVLLWALGIGISVVGSFKTPREFGLFGLLVSLISFVFMGYFLVLPTWLAEPVERIVKGETVSEKTNVVSGAETPQNRTLSDILSSFRYPEVVGGNAVSDVESPEPAPAEADVVSDEPEREPSAPTSFREEPSGTRTEGVVRFPIARFAEISKRRTTWPRMVRLTRPRTISLWDSDRKEIMGKMEVPAKSVVEVLDVRADGSLFVLDCTGQAFSVLAADTDFARVYTEKNDAGSED